jgi:signal transduction histidine kinase
VPAERQDEIGDLARAFNDMAASLERSRVELADRAADLERSNRELEDYASITSHDLQGPLVTVGMYAEMLTQRLKDDPESRQLAENIRDGAAGMRRLVRELLAYARLERRAIEPEPVQLGTVVREVLETLAGPITDADADVQVEPLPTVMGDPARLLQLLQNLLTNAIKFNAEGVPRVEIYAVRDGEMAIVSVRDHGIGMDPEKTEVIFRPFHRLHGAERYAGTGIGLAVCHKIVDQHGGRIWAESTPGHGATFSFTLRLADAPVADDWHLNRAKTGAATVS